MSADASSLLKHRIVFLSEEVTQETANRVIPELLLLEADNHDLPIDLYINSPGGSITAGLAIIDTMQCVQAPVSTICIGMASSVAAPVLAAGAKGKRFASPNAEIMIHQSSGGFKGQTSAIRVCAGRMQRQERQLVDLLAKWTGSLPASGSTSRMTTHFPCKEGANMGVVTSGVWSRLMVFLCRAWPRHRAPPASPIAQRLEAGTESEPFYHAESYPAGRSQPQLWSILTCAQPAP